MTEEHPPDEYRPDLKGDGWDPEPLWRADQVAAFLNVREDAVYDLPIKRIKISPRRIRWRPADVRAFAERRVQDPDAS